MTVVPIQEGFRGQRLIVVPRPAVAQALRSPVTRRLMVTDVGYYPDAADHRMVRPNGTPETIVIVCSAGTGWVRLRSGTHRVGARQALIIPPGEPHEYGAGDRHPWTIWWAHLAGTDVAELIGSLGVSVARPTVEVRAVERAVALLDEIVTSLGRDQSPARVLGASGAAWKLLTQIGLDRLLPAPGDPLQRAMTFLEERLDSSVKVPELAALVGVSPSHLSALFRRATGGGVMAYHTSLRMAHARQLLDVTESSVGDVAREVGYDDPFYFSRQFRRLHGVSPSEFRTRYSSS